MRLHAFVVMVGLLALIGLPWAAGAQEAGGLTIHVVQRGETLYSIATRYGLTISDIAQVNSLANPNSIDVGDRLLIPLAGQPIPRVHIVQPGETLDAIATVYGLSANDLSTVNQLDSPALYVGQALAIATAPTAEPAPAVVAAVPAEASTSTVIHSVARGETLFRIAMGYGVSVNSIVQANGLANPELIYAGQMLVIPGVEAPQLTTSLPAPVSAFTVTPLSLLEGRSGRYEVRTTTPATVTGSFLNQVLQFAADADGLVHTALIGVPVGTEPGIYPVNVIVTDTAGVQAPVAANVQVNEASEGQDAVIQVTGDAALLLNEAVEQQEMDLMRSLMSTFSPTHYFEGAFGLPAAATITSAFGSTRSYNNGELVRTHTGTDFGGGPGASITAPAAGRVVMVDTLNIRGLATVIDHGWGVYTGYWHQSATYVQPGDFVQEGQVIGAIGSSGRVSGPHLHWELWVNGVPVDPMQWVVQDFSQ
ncbi:MAG TPA: LysM peptidoglycan-binding domain-containing protein [Candidatus Limnocylindrales bacterium]|nr:LysM peptidoglycan-binding domain-containing protein [Candidatus Limnocylindrales bacterium]